MSSDATVRVTYDQTDIYDQLVNEYGVFDSYLDLFVFAAAVGYANNRCVTSDYGGESEMLWMHFTNKTLYKAVAAAIAYNHHNDPEALIDPEIQLETLAKYAAGGADLLETEFGEISGDPMNSILNYIQDWENQEDTQTRQTVLEEIMSSFDDDMYDIAESQTGD